jgi:hypothetical protein
VFFTVLLSAVPGVASAAAGPVTPILDCYRVNSDGSYTIVLGYTNAGTTTRNISYGTSNVLYPSRFQGSQPTRFVPGTQRGVFTLRVTPSDLYSGARWDLDGRSLNYATITSATECSPSTPLPALGNGTGIAVALLAGAAFGVFFVRRLIRRAVPAG